MSSPVQKPEEINDKLELNDKIKPNANTYILALGKLGIEATDDKIVVVEDRFTNGSECRSCGGTGESNTECSLCHGVGEEPIQGGFSVQCRACGGTGHKPCEACNGEGYPKNVIIAPQTAQRRPSTGTIVSVGPLVGKYITQYPTQITLYKKVPSTNYRGEPTEKEIENYEESPTIIDWGTVYFVGDRIIYSNFAGVAIELRQKIVIRIMRAHEILSKLYSIDSKFPMGTVLGGGAV
jgi:co-chaperonin GroES (HSP10)